METVTLNVEGMKCSGCSNALNAALRACPGVSSATASHTDKNVVVEYEPGRISLEQVKKVVTEAGYKVV